MRPAFVLILFFCQLCQAQQHTFQANVFSARDGLSNNQVNTITQDQRGYLWIGTAEGLNRFDGHSFRHFFSEPTDSNTLTGNYILDLLEYKPGKMLIATNNGLSLLNTYTNNFENGSIHIPALKRGSGNVVSNLFKDSKGRVWVNYNGHIDILDDALQLAYPLSEQPWAAAINGINIFYEKCVEDADGQVWLPSDNQGIRIIDEKHKQVYYAKNNPQHYPFFSNEAVRSFYMDKAARKIWYGLWGKGLQYYNLLSGASLAQHFNVQYVSEASCVNSIIPQDDGSICCAGGEAIYRVDSAGLNYTVLTSNNSNTALPQFFSSECIFKDRMGNNWVGTTSHGLLEIATGNSPLSEYDIPLKKNIPGYIPFCSDILQMGNETYIAYNLPGLITLNSITGSFAIHPILSPEGKPADAYRLCIAGNNRIWIGTGLGIYSFDPVTKKIAVASELPAFVQHGKVSAMANDGNGNTWIAFTAPNAIGYYNRKGKQFSYFKDYIAGGRTFFDPENKITSIKTDRSGNTWFSSNIKGGFACYEYATGKWLRFPLAQSKYYDLLTRNGIADFTAGHDKVLWISLKPGSGLARYDYEHDSLRFFTRRDGLLSSNIIAVDQDRDNNLVLLSANGINYLDTRSNELQSREFGNPKKDWFGLYNQYYDSLNNRMLFFTDDKLLALQDKFNQEDEQQINVYLEDIFAGNKRINDLTAGQITRLGHAENNISIGVTTPYFARNPFVHIAYMLEGYDKDWITGDTLRRISYNNLPPGPYNFLVKAKSQAGSWGAVNSAFRFTIVPAVWETWWFRLLCLLFISLIIGLIIHYRIRAVRTRAELKQRISETEMAALQAQMNPHFIFNSLNAIDNLIQTNQADKATTYLSRFARLIRSVLEGAKNNTVPFAADFESMQLYLQMEQFRCNNKFSYELEADDELMHSDHRVPAMLVQPFIENAIQHGLLNKPGADRILKVNIRLQGDWIIYTITDNGVGREKAMALKTLNRPEHHSDGIRISTERLNLFNKHSDPDAIFITDLSENGSPSGTMVTVKVDIAEK